MVVDIVTTQGLQVLHYVALVCMVLATAGLAWARRRIDADQTRLHAQAQQLERLALAAERSPSSFVITDEARRIVWVNEAFTRMTGYRADEVLGKRPGAFLLSDRTAPETVAQMREAIDRGEGARVEVLNRTKDGRDYWLDLDIQPYRDRAGSHAGFIAVQADITPRMLEQLRMRTILETMPVGMVTHALSGAIVDCNAAASTILGLTRDQLLGRASVDPRWRCVREDGSPFPGEEHPAMRTLATGESARSVVMGVHNPDGALRWLSVDAEAIRDPVTGATTGVIAIFGDVTDARAHAEQLQLATASAEAGSRAKTTFLAAMSHELRTPLNGVLGLTDVLLTRDHDGDTRELLETIRRSGDALLALLNDILDLSKIEAGHMSIEPAPFVLPELLEAVRELYVSRAIEKDLYLDLRIDPSTPARLLADPFRLRQVVLNLVSNALKFTSQGGVAVVASHQGETLTLSVTDTGMGMPSDVCEHLFEPFYQAESGARRRVGGTGLGLAISRKLSRAMGGDITVSSDVGVGSTFTVTITARPAPVAPLAPAPTSLGPADHLPRRVLLVEDNVVNQKVARLMLERLGISTIIAYNGAEALARLAVERVDLVLMDCHMPVMDGFEATRRIRALPDERSVLPILALTAALFDDERRAILEAGMDAVVPKPIQTAVLRAAMGAAMVARGRTAAELAVVAPTAVLDVVRIQP
jgi:two-component system sensor histidine kinase/response regulator